MIIVLVSLVVMGIVGWSIWSVANQKSPVPLEQSDSTSDNKPQEQQSGQTDDITDDSSISPGETPSTEKVAAVIVTQNPSLVDPTTKTPNFTVVSSKQPIPGWYVASIQHTAVTTSNAVVVLRNIDNKLVIVAGPGTGLTTDKSLPQEVRDALYE